MARILIVEDDFDIANSLKLFLKKAGFEFEHHDTGEHVVKTVRSNPPDLILLDVMLPVMDGIECCKQIRTFSDVPIIMMTAKVEEIDRLIGLEAGADDYVCKPFSGAEMMLRIKAILRRTQGMTKSSRFSVNDDTYHISFNTQSVGLTNVEYQLFHLLHKHPGKIYSRNQIMDHAYPDMRDLSDRTIDSHVKNIRKKIKQLGITSTVIDSVYGAGYRYIEPD